MDDIENQYRVYYIRFYLDGVLYDDFVYATSGCVAQRNISEKILMKQNKFIYIFYVERITDDKSYLVR